MSDFEIRIVTAKVPYINIEDSKGLYSRDLLLAAELRKQGIIVVGNLLPIIREPYDLWDDAASGCVMVSQLQVNPICPANLRIQT